MYTYVFVCAPQLSQLSADCTAKRKELENRHLLVQQRVRSLTDQHICPSRRCRQMLDMLFKEGRIHLDSKQNERSETRVCLF